MRTIKLNVFSLILLLGTDHAYATGIDIPVNSLLLFDLVCFVAAFFIVARGQKKILTLIWAVILLISYLVLDKSQYLNTAILSLIAPASILFIAIIMRMYKSGES